MLGRSAIVQKKIISVSINSLKMHRDLIVNTALLWAETAAFKLRSLCIVV
jgi:hypothetical protein